MHCALLHTQTARHHDLTNLYIVACQDHKAFCSTLLPWLIHECRYLSLYASAILFKNSLHPWCFAVWVCNNTQCTMQQFRRQPFLNLGVYLQTYTLPIVSRRIFHIYRKFSIKPPGGLLCASTLEGRGLLDRGNLIMREA